MGDIDREEERRREGEEGGGREEERREREGGRESEGERRRGRGSKGEGGNITLNMHGGYTTFRCYVRTYSLKSRNLKICTVIK